MILNVNERNSSKSDSFGSCLDFDFNILRVPYLESSLATHQSEMIMGNVLRTNVLSLIAFLLCISSSPGQNQAPKGRVENGESKRAAGMVEILRTKLPKDNPANLADALAAWREMTEYLRSSSNSKQFEILLTHPDPSVRREAALLLSELSRTSDSAESATKLLTGRLNDRDSDVRTAALKALTRMAPLGKSSLPAVLELLKDDDPRIRRYAYLAVSRWVDFDSTLLPHVIAALDDPDIGAPNFAAGINSVSFIAMNDLARKFKGSGKEAVPKLEKLSQSKKFSDQYVARAMATWAAISPEDPKLLQMSRQLLQGNTPEEWLRGTSLLGYLGIHGKAAIPDLIEILRKKPLADKKLDERVKIASVGVLRLIGPDAKDALPAIYGLPYSEDAIYRQSIYDALRTIERRELK